TSPLWQPHGFVPVASGGVFLNQAGMKRRVLPFTFRAGSIRVADFKLNEAVACRTLLPKQAFPKFEMLAL
ncbi:MAG: hypothetical protein KDI49_18880, partial [Gammaproteobacteria bacterium]|nr:hypothetical protein [Gammaproteobacteria bacterium]